MTTHYRRGRKHYRRHPFYPAVDMRLAGQIGIYPRVACAVARWIRQQRPVRTKREE